MEGQILFKGLTRPPMLFGVPMTPLFLVISAVLIISVMVNIFFVILAIPVYYILKGIAKSDDYIFDLFFLKMRFFTNPLNRKYFKAKTYSAVKYQPISRKIDFPKLSIFGIDANPSIEKLIPYSSLIADDVAISKDGMLLASWQIAGIPFELQNDIDISSRNNSLNMLFKAFAAEPCSFYFHNARHEIKDRFTSKFNNYFLREIDERYFRAFAKGTLRNNSLFITLIFNPFSNAIDKSNFKKLDYTTKKAELKEFLAIFKEYTKRLESNLEPFSPTRLGIYEKDGVKFSTQLEFYNYLIGGRFMPIRVINAPINEYICGNLKNLQFNHDMMQFNYNDSTKRFARAVEIKDYTPYTFAGILDTLMYLNVDYTITQSFVPISNVESKAILKKQRKQLIASEDDSTSQITEFEEALDNITSGEICFGKYHFSVLCYGNSIKEAQDNTNIIARELNEAGFSVTLADIALPATYFAQFPCNFGIRPRAIHITSANYSSLIALHNFSIGKRTNNCWGDATTIIKTPNGQPYYLNFHQSTKGNDFGDKLLGNTLVIGQSGSGKTVFMSFLVNQMMKYANVDSFPSNVSLDKRKFSLVFLDKDKGALGNILCAGGRYITINNGKPTGFNPFMCEASESNIRNLQSLMKLCVTRNGARLTTKEEKKLNDAINFIMRQFEKDERKFPISLLLESITERMDEEDSLKSRLEQFKKGKQFGWVFDNENDILDFPDSINAFGIDGTEFLDDKDVSAIMSYYILWRVMDLADGRRLVVDIDEAWKWLENSVVAEEVKNKFKTIRKQNGLLRLGTQSPEDFIKLPISKTLIEQSATMIFLPNPKAQFDDYVKGFNLTPEEYEFIRDTDPTTRQFVVKRQNESVICTLDLSSIGKENLKILSTSSEYIDKIEKIFAQSDKDYIQKVAELQNFYKKI